MTELKDIGIILTKDLEEKANAMTKRLLDTYNNQDISANNMFTILTMTMLMSREYSLLPGKDKKALVVQAISDFIARQVGLSDVNRVLLGSFAKDFLASAIDNNSYQGKQKIDYNDKPTSCCCFF